MFFSDPNMSPVFDAYLTAGEGDPSGLVLLNLLVKVISLNPVFGDRFGKGASADRKTNQGVESVRLGNSVMGAPKKELLWSIAPEWPVTFILQKLRTLQETDMAMLLVADSSLFVYQPLSFMPGLSLPMMAKLLVAALVVLPVVILVVIVLVVRRHRHHRTSAKQADTTVAERDLIPQ